jgi:uncharacterized protein YjiK
MKLFKVIVVFLLVASIQSLVAQTVVMNEVYSRGTTSDPDWIELYNTTTSPIDISGYKIYDSGGQSGSKTKKSIPTGTTIAAHGFYVVVTDDGASDAFGLSSSGEEVWLENASGTVIDTVTFPAMATNQSYGRSPDGAAYTGAGFNLISERTIDVKEPSGLAYNAARGTLFCVGDNQSVVYELSLAGDILNKITVSSSDMEGITFSKNYDTMFVIEEGNYKVQGYTLSGVKGASWSIVTSSATNSAYEGVTRLPNDDFIVLNEKDPTLALHATHTGTEISRQTLSLSSDLSDICYDSTLQCYWIISDESKKVMKVKLDFSLIGEWTESIAQGEGIAVVGDRMYLCSDSDSKFYIYTKPSESSSAPWKLLNTLTKGKSNVPTEVSELKVNIPGYGLSQNYPNPFNPSTTITYSLPSHQYVELKVFDMLGNEVAALVQEEKPAGQYQVQFNAAGLPSGIYLYSIRAGSYSKTNKLVVLK